MKLETTTESKTIEFERVKLEEGIHTATLKEVKDISEGIYGERLAFIYEIEGKELAHVVYKKVATPENGLGKVLIAHGVDLSTGSADTDNLPNKQVRAMVEDYDVQKDGKPLKDAQGKQVVASTISKVKPLTEKVE